MSFKTSRPIDPEQAGDTPVPRCVGRFERELAAFRAMQPDLRSTHAGLYVAVKGGRVVDHDRDELALVARVQGQYRNEFVLVRKVDDSADVRHARIPSPMRKS